MTSVFTTSGWTVSRGTVQVGPLDLDIAAGDIITLMGPSGIGKTTLMLTLLGYVHPALRVSGERRLKGKPLGRSEIPGDALYIPQQAPFNPNWEVRAFLCRLPWQLADSKSAHRHSAERAAHVDRILSHLGLAHRARATVAQLSGGEIQRAALAQLLLLRPRLLVADEFVSALDPGMAAWILDETRATMHATEGAAILALHDVTSALRVSSRILVLSDAIVDPVPVRLGRGSAGWSPDGLYALLCIARWTMGRAIGPQVRLFSAIVRSWAQASAREGSALAAAWGSAGADTVTLHADAMMYPATDELRCAVDRALSLTTANVVPLRLGTTGGVIGIAIRGTDSQYRTLLIEL